MGNRTALFSRRQVGGMFVIDDFTDHPGDIFFVDSGNSAASDSVGYGRNPDSPFATLDYAVSNCTEANGDVIYVMPGHTESLVTDSSIDLDVAGISVIGLGKGDNRPMITSATHASASFAIGADDIYVENLVFICNITNQDHMIDIVGDNFHIKNCEFRESATGLFFISSATTDGDSDYCTIEDCTFYSPSANGDAAINLGKDHTGWTIRNCNIYGDFDEAGIDVPAGGNASARLLIENNRITNIAAGQHAIQINGTAVTGWAINNKLQTNAQATAFDSSALSCHGNTWVDTDGNNDEEAVPANSQHATGTMLTALQADAITAAKIGDDAISEEHIDQDAAQRMAYGIKVSKTSAALPGGTKTTGDLFSITGGRIVLNAIVGEVTTKIQAQANNTKLQSVPTTGSTVDIAADLDITGDVTGTFYGITGLFTDAIVGGAGGATVAPRNGVICPVGTIRLYCAATNSGEVKWDVYYTPLDTGASVAAV